MATEICITEYMLMYMMLYKQAQEIIDRTNPCLIEIDNNGQATCDDGRKCSRGSFCCTNCKYLSSTGCTVNSLACKMWLCGIARYNFQIIENITDIEKRNNIRIFMEQFNIDVFGDRYSANDVLDRCERFNVKTKQYLNGD